MNDINYGHNQLASSSCAADVGREIISSRASALAAAKAVHHQQIALLVKALRRFDAGESGNPRSPQRRGER